jgi:hypothetical protein
VPSGLRISPPARYSRPGAFRDAESDGKRSIRDDGDASARLLPRCLFKLARSASLFLQVGTRRPCTRRPERGYFAVAMFPLTQSPRSQHPRDSRFAMRGTNGGLLVGEQFFLSLSLSLSLSLCARG